MSACGQLTKVPKKAPTNPVIWDASGFRFTLSAKIEAPTTLDIRLGSEDRLRSRFCRVAIAGEPCESLHFRAISDIGTCGIRKKGLRLYPSRDQKGAVLCYS